MKKILVIKAGISTGGTTSSFFSFLQAMGKQNQIMIDTWVAGGIGKYASIVPKTISLIESSELTDGFFWPTGGYPKIAYILRSGQLFWYIQERILKRKENIAAKERVPVWQNMDLKRAMSRQMVDLTVYDAVMTWEELFPCYFLAERVKAKKKIAFIHPDYRQAGFDARIDRSVFEKLDAVVAVSETSRANLERMFPDMSGKFYSIRNCLPVDIIIQSAAATPDDFYDGEKKFTIVTVARIQNVSKAIDRAIRIAQRLKEQHLEFQWIFVGDGEDRLRMERLAKECGVADGIVRFLGERKNPYGYMRSADLFVMQSYYEGMPVVVDESMILGTPVVASRYAAADEQVDIRYGVIAENDEESIFKAIRDLIREPQRLEILRANLKHINRSNYMSPTGYLKMLDSVLNSKSREI